MRSGTFFTTLYNNRVCLWKFLHDKPAKQVKTHGNVAGVDVIVVVVQLESFQENARFIV